MQYKISPIALTRSHKPSLLLFDLFAFIIIFAIITFFAIGFKKLTGNISAYEHITISLSPSILPYYALMTTLRMLLAVVISFLFTVIVATLAAKNAKAEAVIIPILDILQSVPVLGYISFTITGFMALFPGRILGLEMAAIFAIFTAQVWNMTFSLYQSLKTLPQDMHEASAIFGLSPLKKFFQVELPFAMPGLIWNMMVSMSGSWFFIVASETISVGNLQYTLPGIGSYIALAIKNQDLVAITYAIITMTIVILLYDQLLFRPLVAWSDKFRYELSSGQIRKTSWLIELFSKAPAIKKIFSPLLWLFNRILKLFSFSPRLNFSQLKIADTKITTVINFLWYVAGATAIIAASLKLFNFLSGHISFQEVIYVISLGVITMLRIIVLIIIVALVWIPIGVYIGFRPKLAAYIQPLLQFLAAFPANLAFPLFAVLIVNHHLNPNIWLSPLIVLGTQWYILFNVIAGALSIPGDLREATDIFHIKGWLKWRKVILPAIFPYLITGMITASGGAWNATIVAEAVSWGTNNIYALGLGSYITEKTNAGDFVHITLGILVMCAFVIIFNKVLWRPLYNKAINLIHLD